jgi:hypothetical protein
MIISSLILAGLLSVNSVDVTFARDKNAQKNMSIGLGGRFVEFKAGLIPPENALSNAMPLFYGQASIGLKVEAGWFYAKAFQGVAYFSRTQYGLATKYQFPTTLGAGLQNESYSIGINWVHYSNGTSNYKNSGREYMGIELGFKF